MPVAATIGDVKLTVIGAEVDLTMTPVAAHRPDDEESTHGGDETA